MFFFFTKRTVSKTVNQSVSQSVSPMHLTGRSYHFSMRTKNPKKNIKTQKTENPETKMPRARSHPPTHPLFSVRMRACASKMPKTLLMFPARSHLYRVVI